MSALYFFCRSARVIFFKSSAPAASYELHSRAVSDHEYEIVIEGKRDIPIEQLKHEFKAHGQALCHERVYLLRGMREEMLPIEHKIILTGLVDCVGLNYFDHERKA
ncbi:MAG: hypothetical protein LW823_09030 [Rickettsiales bacterium]|jgi:hypothetical protein|nr:hypothetical protein [Rickettsiales bacterium]